MLILAQSVVFMLSKWIQKSNRDSLKGSESHFKMQQVKEFPMFTQCLKVSLILSLIIFVSLTSHAEDNDSAAMAEMLPSAVNSIVIVHVREILNSERGKKEAWRDSVRERFLHGTTVIPHWVDTFVMGSLIRPSADEKMMSAGIFSVPKSITIQQLALKENAEIEKLGKRLAVRTMTESYLVRLKPGQFAFLSPTFRQATARWIAGIDAKRPSEISPYLQQASKSKAHIVLAFDVQEMFEHKLTEEFIGSLPAFEDNALKVKALSDLMVVANGVKFECSIDTASKAKIEIQFSKNIENVESNDIKNLFIEIVNHSGSAVDEFTKAKPEISGSTFSMSMSLSDQSLRQIMSLVSAPPLPSQSPNSNLDTAKDRINERASKKYFLAVNDALDDLSRLNQKKSTYEKTVNWHERFAQRIGKLQTTGVDSELIDYGLRMKQNVQALAASLRGVAIKVDAQQRSVTWNKEYDPGWGYVNIWGGVGGKGPSTKTTSNLKEVREKQAAAVTKGANEREAIWKMIGEERLLVTRKMNSKYGSDFIDPKSSK